MPALDVDAARRATSGCHAVAHLNNAGAALPPDVVVETVVAHLRREASIGGYEAAAEAAPALDAVYDSIAALVGADRDEIALAESATRAWDLAFTSLGLGAGDVVLTGEAEYSSNVLAYLHAGRRTGVTVEVLPSEPGGGLDVEALQRRLADLGGRADGGRVGLVALTHVPTSNGLVHPAAEVGGAARAAGVPFLLDACQSVGQLDVDVAALGCDLLSATGRKFLRGPRGTGFLYVSRTLLDRLDPPTVDLRSAEWTGEDTYELASGARRFETWESSVATRLGLGAAVGHALSWGMPAIEQRVTELAGLLRTRLHERPGVTVHDTGRQRSGIVTFSVAGAEATDVVAQLRRAGVHTSVSAAGSAHLDLGRRGLGDVVRASVHYYNTEDELERLLDALPPA